jgi:hypothetical protein
MKGCRRPAACIRAYVHISGGGGGVIMRAKRKRCRQVGVVVVVECVECDCCDGDTDLIAGYTGVLM